MSDENGILLMPYKDLLEIRVFENGKSRQMIGLSWDQINELRAQATEDAPFVIVEEKARGDADKR